MILTFSVTYWSSVISILFRSAFDNRATNNISRLRGSVHIWCVSETADIKAIAVLFFLFDCEFLPRLCSWYECFTRIFA
jgi:hypothetical protein